MSAFIKIHTSNGLFFANKLIEGGLGWCSGRGGGVRNPYPQPPNHHHNPARPGGMVQRYPVNMPLVASTGSVLDLCWQHRLSTGPVLAHTGMFMMGLAVHGVLKYFNI